jgi:hypothetical protein
MAFRTQQSALSDRPSLPEGPMEQKIRAGDFEVTPASAASENTSAQQTHPFHPASLRGAQSIRHGQMLRPEPLLSSDEKMRSFPFEPSVPTA